MRKRKFAVLRLLIASEEMDAVCRALKQYGFRPQFDTETPTSAYHGMEKKSGGDSPYTHTLSHLRFVLDVAGKPLPEADIHAALPEDWHEKAEALYKTCRTLQKEKTQLQEQEDACRQGQKKLELFGDLTVDMQDIAECTFIRVRFGHMPAESYERMRALYADNPYVEFFPSFSDGGEIFGMYFAPRDMAQRIDAIFASLLFESLAIPSLSGNTAEIGTEFERSLHILETELSDVEQRLERFFAKEEETVRALYAALAGAESLFALKAYATCCKGSYILTGLLPEERLRGLYAVLENSKQVYVIRKGCVKQRFATA